MELLYIKLVAVMALGVAALICGLIPLKFRKLISRDRAQPTSRRRELILSGLLCFGAGVLLAAVMIHILPEVREGFMRAKALEAKVAVHDAENILTDKGPHEGHDHSEEPHRADPRNQALEAEGSHGDEEANNKTKPDHTHDHHDHSHVDHDHSDQLHNKDLHLQHDFSSSSALPPHSPHEQDDHGQETHEGHAHEEPHHDTHEGRAHEEAHHDTHEGHAHEEAHHDTHEGHDHEANDHMTTDLLDTSTTESLLDEPTAMPPVRRRRDVVPDPEMIVKSPDVPYPPETKESIVPPMSHIDHGEAFDPHAHSAHQHDEDHHGHEEHGYPLTELVVCAGFFIVYFIEEVVHWAFSVGHHDHTGHGHSHLNMLEEGTSTTTRPLQNGVSVAKPSTYKKGLGRRGVWRPSQIEGIDNPVYANDHNDTQDKSNIPGEAKDQEVTGRRYSSVDLASNEVLEIAVEKPAKPGCGQIMMENIRSLLMVVALSFHSIFEGLAIGLQENARDTWYLTFAVAAHKLVIQFCMGMELLVIGASTKTVILYIVVMSLTNPVGAALGMFLTHDGAFFADPQQLFLITILQGFAGGTILYVTFFEILERERSKPGGRFIKFFSLFLGFAFLAVIENFGGHSHGPSDEAHAH